MSRVTCGAKRTIGQPPHAVCFRQPHSNLEAHVAESGTEWPACKATRHAVERDQQYGSGVRVELCALPDRHEGDHEDRSGVRWMNDPYWEITETKNLRMGDIVRSTDYGEPLAVFNASDWTVTSQGITSSAPYFYRLKIRGYRFGYLDREPSREEIVRALTPVTFRDLVKLFWNWVRSAKK